MIEFCRFHSPKKYRNFDSEARLEAEIGIEPLNAAFAEQCLATWLLRHKAKTAYGIRSLLKRDWLRVRMRH
jgi:hypothetical protein